MKKLYILRYSQLTQSDMSKSIIAFVQQTKLKPDLIVAAARQQGGLPLNEYKPEELEEVLQGAIYLFKIGKIDEETFIARMNQAIGSNLDPDTFKQCWNAMCTIQPQTLASLRQIESLQQQYDFDIHVIGNTNSIHADYIKEQFEAASLNIRMSHTYSFESGMFDPKPQLPTTYTSVIDLRKLSIEEILEEFSKLSIEETPKTTAPKCKLFY